MNGRGKSAKSVKGGAAKRHRRQTASANKISGPAIRRLARRGGVARVGSGCFPEVNAAAVNYITDILDASRAYCLHGKRKTINALDVIYALKTKGTKYMTYINK